MTTPFVPPPGMIGLTQISGSVGKTIEFGQWLNGEGFECWEHAFVVLPDGQILEAEPGPDGAVISPVTRYSNVYWCENVFKLLPQPRPSDARITEIANQLKGTPYSFADYAALAAHRLHIWAPFLKTYVQTSKHEICSQLADDFYQRLGVPIFTDGRWNGDVTPGSLFRRDLELGL